MIYNNITIILLHLKHVCSMLSKDLLLLRIENMSSLLVSRVRWCSSYVLPFWLWKDAKFETLSWKSSSSILEFLHWNWDFMDRTSMFAFIYIFKFIHDHLLDIFMCWLLHDLLWLPLNFIILHGLPFILLENTNHKTFILFKQKNTYLWQSKSLLYHPVRELASFHHM